MTCGTIAVIVYQVFEEYKEISKIETELAMISETYLQFQILVDVVVVDQGQVIAQHVQIQMSLWIQSPIELEL